MRIGMGIKERIVLTIGARDNSLHELGDVLDKIEDRGVVEQKFIQRVGKTE